MEIHIVPVRTLTEKFKRLMEYAGFIDIFFESQEVGGFLLVAYDKSILAIADHYTTAEYTKVVGSIIEVGYKPVPVTGAGALAYLLTGGLYLGFHDKMGWAIKLSRFYSEGFLGLGERKPRYREIRRALEYAGYSTDLERMAWETKTER